MIPCEIENKIISKKVPISMQMELTWKCNQKCSHCYQYSDDKTEIPLNKAKDIINQLADAGALYLSFTGGEPMMHKDFWKILEHAFNKHFAVSIQTNGMFIDEYAARKFKDLNILAAHLSIHGSNASIHDSITGIKGSFDKLLKASHLLKQSGIKTVFNFTLLKQNFSERHKIIKLKEKIAPDAELRISPYLYPKNDGTNDNNRFKIKTSQAIEFFEEKVVEGKEMATGLLCNFGSRGCAINPKGEVYPCSSVPLVAGNLNKASFLEIWTNSPVFKRIREVTEADLKECANCDVKEHCFRCSGFSYAERKSLFDCSYETKKTATIIKKASGTRERIREKNEKNKKNEI